MPMKRLSLALIALSSPAFAHPGDHSGTGLFHLLTEPDHLAMVAVLLVVVVGGVLAFRSRS
jgi:hydrogenase/urease accessory protein HupE